MADSPLTLFCLVDGEKTAFPVEFVPSDSVGKLKDLIKAKKSVVFEHVDANNLTLWKVSIPVVPNKERKAISLAEVPWKEELDEMDDLSDVFKETPPKKTIHVIIQRPPPSNANALAFINILCMSVLYFNLYFINFFN